MKGERGLLTLIGIVMLCASAVSIVGWKGPVAVIGAYLIWRAN